MPRRLSIQSADMIQFTFKEVRRCHTKRLGGHAFRPFASAADQATSCSMKSSISGPAAALLLAGIIPGAAEAADFARVVQSPAGSWSFSRSGQLFFSMGVCHIAAKSEGPGRSYDGIKTRGSEKAWANAAVQRLVQNGFNTAGAWSDEPIYSQPLLATRYLWLGVSAGGTSRRLANVFSPGYPTAVDAVCKEFVAPHRDDPRLIGWFLDNELPWYGEFGWPADGQKSLLELYIDLPGSDPNHAEAVRFLKAHYQTFDRFTAQWEVGSAKGWDDLPRTIRPKTIAADFAKMAWAGKVADRFFSVAVAAVRKYDRGHLILGSRFAGNAPGPVIASCAKHCDVVSINRYIKDGAVDVAWWDHLYAIAQKPIFVTEFSFRAVENRSGNRNTIGADVTVPTQHDRAERYSHFVGELMKRPYIVGMHWFEWCDQPSGGRASDGEDSNYGLVDVDDREYEELLAAARATNQALPLPSKRTGPLPAADDRDGTRWSAPPVATLPVGTLAESVEALGSGAPFVTVDRNGASRVTPAAEGSGWKLAYDSGTGWGFTAAWPPPVGKPLAGARHIRLSVKGAPGTLVGIAFNELGHDKQSVPNDAADGESWMIPARPIGSDGTIDFDLGEAQLNRYYGNQSGRRRVDLDALADIAIQIPGRQGSGTLEVTSIRFEP